ncbi:MAG: hypothetical protein JWM98_3067 [Thermoleophilia bacterium]|nr:hypothetical protein [Thermoleophilia bacterium]
MNSITAGAATPLPMPATLPAGEDATAPTRRPSAEERFARLDADGDGALSPTEFAAGMPTRFDSQRRGGPGGMHRHHGPHGGGRPEGGRSHDDFAAAVRGAQVDGGGTVVSAADDGSEVTALRAQVQSLSGQLQAVLAQLGLGDGAAATSAATGDAAAGASDLATQDHATEKAGYQYSTDEAGATYASDEAGNVFTVAADGTGTLVQDAPTGG